MNRLNLLLPSSPSWALILAVGAVCGSACMPHTHGQSGPAQVVLLTNGAVLRGKVGQGEGSWSVKTAPGATVVLPLSRVAGVFDSMDSAFQWQRSRLSPRDPQRLISLGFWAIRHDYPPGATSVLMECLQQGITDPRVEALESEIRRMQSKGTPATKPATEAPKPAPFRWSRAAVRQFHAEVEPILMASCGSSGCHGPGGTLAFRLVAPHPTANWEDSESHNLRTTKHLIDTRVPLRSRLLQLATQSHGGNTQGPPLDRDSREYRVLVDWLQSLGDDAVPQTNTVVPTGAATPVLFQQPPAGGALYHTSVPKVPRTTTSTDPYDPAIFNHN